MKRKYIFLIISIIGISYTWFYNIQYFTTYEEASLVHFFELAQSNFAGKSFGKKNKILLFHLLKKCQFIIW